MKFGIKELDKLINIDNKLITIASRPGMGKSSLVIKIARNVSTNNNVPINPQGMAYIKCLSLLFFFNPIILYYLIYF